MISMLVLQTEHGRVLQRIANTKPISAQLSARGSGLDYFSLAKSNNRISPTTSAWARVLSPKPPPIAPPVSSSNSSRGSWSSLFNSGTMRQFMSGVQDTLLLTPSELPVSPQNTTAKSSDKTVTRLPESPRFEARKRRSRKNSFLIPPAIVSNSWRETAINSSSRNRTQSSSTISRKRYPLRFADSNRLVHEKHVVFEPPPFEEP